MAKNTHSQEIQTGTSDSYTPTEMEDPNPPVVVQRAMLGEVDKPSVGDNSAASTEKPSKTKDSETQNPQEPAHTTESPSSAPETVTGSDVRLTDGDTPTTQTKQSAKPASKKTAKKANSRTTDEEFDEFE